MRLRSFFGVGLVGLVALAGTAEIGTRVSGIADFPLYRADQSLGYVPAPNQRGAFLNRNGWVFNELSMGTDRPFDPDSVFNLLLVGDSIVNGGNPVRQSDRLGPAIEQKI